MSFFIRALFLVFILQNFNLIYASHSNHDEVPKKLWSESKVGRKLVPAKEHHKFLEAQNEEKEEGSFSLLSRTRQYFNDENQHFTLLPTWRERATLFALGAMIYSIHSYLNPLDTLSSVFDVTFNIVDVMACWLMMEVMQSVIGQGKKWFASKTSTPLSIKTKKSLLKKKHREDALYERTQTQEKITQALISRSLLCASNLFIGGTIFYSLFRDRDIHFQEDSEVTVPLPIVGISAIVSFAKGIDDIQRLVRRSSRWDAVAPRNWEYLLNSFCFAILGLQKTILDHSDIESHAQPCVDSTIKALTQAYLNNPSFHHSVDGAKNYILSYMDAAVEFCTREHYLKMIQENAVWRNFGQGFLMAQLRSVFYDVGKKVYDWQFSSQHTTIDTPKIRRQKTFISRKDNESLRRLMYDVETYDREIFSPPHDAFRTISMGAIKRAAQKEIDRRHAKELKKSQREKSERPSEFVVCKKGNVKSLQETDHPPSKTASSTSILSEKQARKFQKLKEAIQAIQQKTNITPLEFNRILNLAAPLGFSTEGKKASGNQTLEIDDKIVDGLHPIHGTNRVEAGRMRVLFTLFDAIKDKYGDAD